MGRREQRAEKRKEKVKEERKLGAAEVNLLAKESRAALHRTLLDTESHLGHLGVALLTPRHNPEA